MSTTPHAPSPSFDQLWAGLNAGDQDAARKLYERFIDQLIRLAAKKLKYQLGSHADPEDVAHSVFESFFEGLQGRAFEARNWGMVFGLLAHITFRKCLKRKRSEMQARRNPGAPVGPLDAIEAATASPGPAEEAMVAELLGAALGRLDPLERQVIDAHLGGRTTDATAQQVGLSTRTVQRIITEFRNRLEQLLRDE